MQEPAATPEMLYQQGAYSELIAALEGGSALATREMALLGIAYLRTGQLAQAERPLQTAAARDDLEARVELGNLYRLRYELAKAETHFEQLLPTLSGELRFRALRWYGVTLMLSGKLGGLERVEEARMGYLGLGDELMVARLSHTLSALYIEQAEFAWAEKLLREALPVLKQENNPRPFLHATNSWIDLLLIMGRVEQAEEVLTEVLSLTHELHEPYVQLQFETQRRVVEILKQGIRAETLEALLDIRSQAREQNIHGLYAYTSQLLANYLSSEGAHAHATRILSELRIVQRVYSYETELVDALLTYRRGDYGSALNKALEIHRLAHAKAAFYFAPKALLFAAVCADQLGDEAGALGYLETVLRELAGLPREQVRSSFVWELKEAESLIARARLMPIYRPLVRAALEDATYLFPGSDDTLSTTTRLELSVLGTPRVLVGGVPCHPRLAHSFGILTYLALHPSSTREEITANLWRDQDLVRSADRFRQCLLDIRRTCGQDLIVREGTHHKPTYRFSDKVSVTLDAQTVLHLIEQGDVAEAVSLYRGSHLERLPETDWLIAQRETLVGSFNRALRQQLTEAEQRGDLQQALLLADILLEIDPEDLEVEEWRLGAAKASGSATQVARYIAERRRRLN